MLYNIVKKSNEAHIILSNLTSNEMVNEVMQRSASGDMDFKVVEVKDEEIEEGFAPKRKTDKEIANLKIEFERTLNFGQRNDLNLGTKELKYNHKDAIGWHLRPTLKPLTKLEETNEVGAGFSVHEAKMNREAKIKDGISSWCIGNQNEMYAHIYASFEGEISPSEFNEVFNKMF